MKDEIMRLADAYAQEVKDFGYLDESPTRAALEAALTEKQEPVAFCDPSEPDARYAFSWPGTDRHHAHTKPLYDHPAPVNQRIAELEADKIELGQMLLNLRDTVNAYNTHPAPEAKPEPNMRVELFHAAMDRVKELEAVNQQLLEALKKLVSVTKHLNPCPGTIEEARAVIAQAEGRV